MQDTSIPKFQKRSEESVKTRGKRLVAQGRLEAGTKSGNYGWTKQEIAKLYEDLDYDQLEKELGRTRRSITSKCEKLGISKRIPGSSINKGSMYPNKPTTVYLVDFGEFKKSWSNSGSSIGKIKRVWEIYYLRYLRVRSGGSFGDRTGDS